MKTPEKDTGNAVEYSGMQLNTCPLECWLGDMNTYSASRLRAARCGEIRGEIWGDLPLLGLQADPRVQRPFW